MINTWHHAVPLHILLHVAPDNRIVGKDPWLNTAQFTFQHCVIIKVSRAGSWRDREWNCENDGSGVYSTLLCQRNGTTATVLYLLSSRLNRDKSLQMVGAVPWLPQSSICYVKTCSPLNPLSPYLVSAALLLAAATPHITWHSGDLSCCWEETKIAENRETECHKEE